MLEGKTNKAVAYDLEIGLRTVERRRKAIFTKCEVDCEVKLAEIYKYASSPTPDIAQMVEQRQRAKTREVIVDSGHQQPSTPHATLVANP